MAETGDVSVDISDGNITAHGGNVVAHTAGTVQLKPPAEEQTNAPGVIASSVDKRALQVGDVLGTDFELPEGLDRLNGWLVFNITEDGVPQALEPVESAPDGVVNWNTAKKHEATLQKQGHKTARLWTESDGSAIFNNVVKGDHNDKAKLDLSGSYPDGRYWEGTDELRDLPVNALVRYPFNGYRHWDRKGNVARVRVAQDVTELSLA